MLINQLDPYKIMILANNLQIIVTFYIILLAYNLNIECKVKKKCHYC